jgi:hypothetical protein
VGCVAGQERSKVELRANRGGATRATRSAARALRSILRLPLHYLQIM